MKTIEEVKAFYAGTGNNTDDTIKELVHFAHFDSSLDSSLCVFYFEEFLVIIGSMIGLTFKKNVDITA